MQFNKYTHTHTHTHIDAHSINNIQYYQTTAYFPLLKYSGFALRLEMPASKIPFYSTKVLSFLICGVLLLYIYDVSCIMHSSCICIMCNTYYGQGQPSDVAEPEESLNWSDIAWLRGISQGRKVRSFNFDHCTLTWKTN